MTWTGQSWGPEQPRFVTDLTGDGRADIVGFGSDGVDRVRSPRSLRWDTVAPTSIRTPTNQ